MCGRFSSAPPSEIARTFETKLPAQLELKKRYNVCPTDRAAVVVLRDGERVLEAMRFGWVPIRNGVTRPLINIRLDSFGRVRAFANALAGRRLLVPCTGFYEWHDGQPFWFHPPSLAAFAGLFTGDAFAIVTTTPNALVAPVHDRMPVVLDASAWSAWLDPGFPADGARELLVVPPVGDWGARRVSARALSPQHDGEDCIAPADEPAQRTLF